MLKNYMEIVVDHMLPSVLKKHENLCTCEICLEDIKAIALNNLKPHYIATEKGEVYPKMKEMERQFETDIISTLVEAIGIVSKRPRHD